MRIYTEVFDVGNTGKVELTIFGEDKPEVRMKLTSASSAAQKLSQGIDPFAHGIREALIAQLAAPPAGGYAAHPGQAPMGFVNPFQPPQQHTTITVRDFVIEAKSIDEFAMQIAELREILSYVSAIVAKSWEGFQVQGGVA